MDEILKHVDEKEIVELACNLVNIPSRTGNERAVGEFVRDWLRGFGIRSFVQEIGGDRVNVVGTIEGIGNGVSLQLNGHLDTNYSGDEDDLIFMSPELFRRPQHTKRSYVRDGRVYGIGIGNMKAGLTAMLTSIVAVKRSGVPLKGDFVVAGVCGENGGAPVDQYQGVQYEGGGFGTEYLLSHGVQTDYAICADNSNFKMTWVSPGQVLLRVTVYGLPGGAWATPHAKGRPMSQNAVIKMLPVIEAIEAWSADYSVRHRYVCEGGELTPTAHIGHIEGGRPYNMAVRPGVCAISVLVMTPPGLRAVDVMREVKDALRAQNLDAEVEGYRSHMGYEADRISGLVGVLRDRHQQLFGTGLPICDPPYCGPWTDTAVYNERGIPCLKLGLGLSAAERLKVGISAYDEHPIDDIVRAAKLYAVTAADVCSRERLD
ncbi:MAG TPA: M20/M25/M40 family metallo-hydrolase [Gemmatimonadales bacterium]|jgi:acetylornithine deacetylase/succinyl-diaminopimelate desuccinylase-like protein|nr:M20/M25/M40 family metallo-hydrolase [Gemmatimonadales bacterium]